MWHLFDYSSVGDSLRFSNWFPQSFILAFPLHSKAQNLVVDEFSSVLLPEKESLRFILAGIKTELAFGLIAPGVLL
jgi:hypothetical protein